MIAFRIASEDKTWWLKERILELEKGIINEKPPKREISKLCYFCKFFNQCNPNKENISSNNIESSLNTKHDGSKL